MSDLQNNLSVVCEALAEESPERLQLQREVRISHKECEILCLQLQRNRKVGQVYSKKSYKRFKQKKTRSSFLITNERNHC